MRKNRMPIILTWNTPDSSSPILGYRIYRHTGNVFIDPLNDLLVTVSATVHTYTDDTVDSLILWNEGYTYGMSAFSISGASDIQTVFLQEILEETIWEEVWDFYEGESASLLWTETWEMTVSGTSELLWTETWDT